MHIDENLRKYSFWILDYLRGGIIRKYYTKCLKSFVNGTSKEETESLIRELLQHACDTTKFYSKYKGSVNLSDYPVVNKNTFRDFYEEFISSKFKNDKNIRKQYTSGSTGTPFCMIQDKRKILRNTAGSLALLKLGGYELGMKQLFVRVWVEEYMESKLSFFAKNMFMFDCKYLTEEKFEELCNIIKSKKIHYIMGYASVLEKLSKYINERSVDCSEFEVKAITPMAEFMSDNGKDNLERQFNCNVSLNYSNNENGIMGIQYENSNEYYLDSTGYYFELLQFDSDEPAAEGEIGRIVITDLYNFAFPIIRYANGDAGVLEKIKSNDNNYKLVLKKLYGRQIDIIYSCNGIPIQPYWIGNEFLAHTSILQYKVIQQSKYEYDVLLNSINYEEDIQFVNNKLKGILGEQAVINIEYVSSIPTLNSGKCRYIENKCSEYI